MYTTSETKLLGVFGYPVGHSISPKLHSLIAEQTNTDISYLAFLASPDEFGKKFNAAKELGIGFNITVPHKIRVMEYLDVTDPFAKRVGAVNTAVNKNGKWHGYNTDGLGFLKSLSLNNISVTGKNILMLGAGGAARSVAYTLAENGAKSITITARTQEKAQNIGDLIEKYTNCKYIYSFNKEFMYDIIINTTPLGMSPYENENPFNNYEIVSKDTVFCDLIYSPWETLFLKEAKKHGARTMNGFGMLVFQGIYAFEHFTDKKFDDIFFEKIYNLFLENIRK